MRTSSWIPSLVANGGDRTVYLVVDEFSQQGRVFRETEVGRTDFETLIADLVSGQYNDPVRIVAFNTAERWAEDVSEDVAREIRRRAGLAGEELSTALETFLERHSRHEQQLTLRLV